MMSTHIDDWLDYRHENPPATEGERFALEWLEHFRRPAVDQDRVWLAAHPLFCTFEGKRWRVTGASRMGDVWLAEDFKREYGYDRRVDVAKCEAWSKEQHDDIHHGDKP